MKRGAIGDRPWGVTLAALAKEHATGELVVIAKGNRYAIAFSRGEIVAAISPAVADSIGRIALTSHLVSSTQVAEITRRIAAQPERDEIEVIAEVARLSKPQVDSLRRRVITQRAARTFAIEQGTFAFDDKGLVHDLAGGAIDTRTVIYSGARMHVPETRLANELRSLGSRFALRLDEDLAKFGFGDAERPILTALRGGTSTAELAATHRELDPRMIAAVIYTLVTFGACGEVSRTKTGETQPARTPTPMRLVNTRVITKEQPVVVQPPLQIPLAISRTMTPQPVISRTMTPPPLAAGSSPMLKRPSVMIPPISAEPEPEPISVRTPTRDLDARDAFQRGEMAMRREQIPQAIAAFSRASELRPEDPDAIAMLAWSKFCAATDKHAIADECRRTIEKAIAASIETGSVTARMCLGRMERMLGRDREALKSFQQVLELQPRHSAAASEARVLEARLRR
jgi:hypothetical protein